jgi:hypothetical protein
MSDAANTFLKDQLSESLEQFSSYERIEVEGEKMIRAAFNQFFRAVPGPLVQWIRCCFIHSSTSPPTHIFLYLWLANMSFTFGLCLFVTLFRFGVLSVHGDLYPHYLASLDRYRIMSGVTGLSLSSLDGSLVIFRGSGRSGRPPLPREYT